MNSDGSMSKFTVKPQHTLCRPQSAGKACFRSLTEQSCRIQQNTSVSFEQINFPYPEFLVWAFWLGWYLSTSITLGFFTTFNCLCLLFSINSLALMFFFTALWFRFLFLLTCSVALWLSLPLLFLCSTLAALLPSLSLGGGEGVVMWGVLYANGAAGGNGSGA